MNPLATLRSIRDDATLSATEALVLTVLVLRSDDGGQCHPSIATIAQDAKIDTRTAQRAVRRLVSLGRLQAAVSSGRQSNLYQIATTNPGIKPPARIDESNVLQSVTFRDGPGPITDDAHPDISNPGIMSPRHNVTPAFSTPTPALCHANPGIKPPQPRHKAAPSTQELPKNYPRTINTDTPKRKRGAVGNASRDELLSVEFPVSHHGESFRAQWAEWVDHSLESRQRGRPITLRAARQHARLLGAVAPETAIEAIRNAISRGWMEPNPAWGQGSRHSTKPPSAIEAGRTWGAGK